MIIVCLIVNAYEIHLNMGMNKEYFKRGVFVEK